MPSPIELRILNGSRAGQTEKFDQTRIAIGRHPSNDLRFDPFKDLDVSTRHGEIRRTDEGGYIVRDNHSTNGTFVNGVRIDVDTDRELHDGDTIMFGERGPRVKVQMLASGTPTPRVKVPATVETHSVDIPISELLAQLPATAVPSRAQLDAPDNFPRIATNERVAIAVAKQTRRLKIAVAGAVVVLGGLGFGAYWAGHREARTADDKLHVLMVAYDSSSKQLQSRVRSTNDTALVRRLETENDSLATVAKAARGHEAVVLQQAMQRRQHATRVIGEMDLPAVQSANDGAVVLIRTEFPHAKNTALEATGFSVSTRGLIVTNRHVVADDGARASKIAVKFANTDSWHTAHLVRMPSDTSVDLALLQVDDGGKYPVVSGFASHVDIPVGGAIASLGFPDGTDLPMEGAIAKTTLTLGTVSKLTDDLMQIDSYASHGSSGSPVFDGDGHVVGAIFGGAPGSGGRIVYAVPANRISELVKAAK